MSRAQLVGLKQWLEQNVSQGSIRQSSSPIAVPLLVTKSPDGGLRFCIDHHGIQSKTVKNCSSLSQIQDSLNLPQRVWIYPKLKVWGASNQLLVKEGDEFK